jgi:predicted DNA-binding transcriptional regulator AlpA
VLNTLTIPEHAQLLSLKQTSALIGCSPNHVRRMAAKRLMPPPRWLGGAQRWSRQELLDWISGGCQPVGEVAGE